ncbi:MAG TPA: cytochrome c3 family protein [Bryobacteraceae bacterium]|jgi:predicted CXXCH cytochrome family protein|nr:cytochrome c3 family protein [Bryobacteraceae bacterium]
MRLAWALLSIGMSFAQPRDPAAWGSDHTGKPLPEHVHGDECLFCHRNDIGQSWQRNTHGISLRQRDDAPELVKKLNPPEAVEFFLGSRHEVRLLKKEGYGKFAILTKGANPAWDRSLFGARCAGCHTTAVETETQTFSAFGHDCYACHGVVDLNHTGDTKLILLSKKRRDSPEVVTSICAQCHLRGGKSRSTGLPYPNQFVAGDNLFRDLQLDFKLADDQALNPGDRHVYRNVRDVVVNGSETTCLSCHKIHGQTADKHRRVLTSAICADCHNAEGPRKAVRAYVVHSELCEY